MESELIVRGIFEQGKQQSKIIPLKTEVKKKKSTDVNYNREVISRQHLPINEAEVDFCIALWRGVVMQAIYDISAFANDYERKLLKAGCYNWFSSEDFNLVCQLAEMNPNRILDLVRMIRCGRIQVLDSKTFKIKRQ